MYYDLINDLMVSETRTGSIPSDITTAYRKEGEFTPAICTAAKEYEGLLAHGYLFLIDAGDR